MNLCRLASFRESSFSMKFNTFFYFIILVVHFILAFLKSFWNRWVSCSKLTLSEHFVSFSLDLPWTSFKLRFFNNVIFNFITSYSILWTFAGWFLFENLHSLWNSIILVVHFILAFLKSLRNRWVSCSKLTLSEHFVSFSLDLPSTCFKLIFSNNVILNFITSYSILWTFAGWLLFENLHSLWNWMLCAIS